MILAQKLDKYWVSNMVIDNFPLKRNKSKKKKKKDCTMLFSFALFTLLSVFFVGNYRNDIRVMH